MALTSAATLVLLSVATLAGLIERRPWARPLELARLLAALAWPVGLLLW